MNWLELISRYTCILNNHLLSNPWWGKGVPVLQKRWRWTQVDDGMWHRIGSNRSGRVAGDRDQGLVKVSRVESSSDLDIPLALVLVTGLLEDITRNRSVPMTKQFSDNTIFPQKNWDAPLHQLAEGLFRQAWVRSVLDREHLDVRPSVHVPEIQIPDVSSKFCKQRARRFRWPKGRLTRKGPRTEGTLGGPDKVY